MIEIQRRLAPGIHDNHGLTLWHDWLPLTFQRPALKAEWQYERDETGTQLAASCLSFAGLGECLTRTVGNVRLRVILGGDGLYTPLAEMEDRHGVKVVGPERVVTSVSPERGDSLFAALAAAEEAAGKIGQPAPPRKKGRPQTVTETPAVENHHADRILCKGR